MVDKRENLEGIRNDDEFTKELEKDALIDLHPDDPMRKGGSDVDRIPSNHQDPWDDFEVSSARSMGEILQVNLAIGESLKLCNINVSEQQLQNLCTTLCLRLNMRTHENEIKIADEILDLLQEIGAMQ